MSKQNFDKNAETIESLPFVLMSATTSDVPCLEVPATGIFQIKVDQHDRLTLHVNVWKRNLGIGDSFTILSTLHHVTEVSPKIKDMDRLLVIPENAVREEWDIEQLMQDITRHSDDFLRIVDNLGSILTESVKLRIEAQPNYCKQCISSDMSKACNDSKLAILFSGGLDSTILALIADRLLPATETIDLVNVAFETESCGFNVPDRLTGLQALKELQSLNVERNYNFIEINVTKNELIRERAGRINHLLHPKSSVLDDSIGCALWFAASATNQTHGSTARVVLLGTGADEQLGGYSR
jgi:asparagine synthetase B (glutamine-hydrolysing)